MSAYPTITAAAAALEAGEITSTELVTEAIAVADRCDAEVGSFIVRYKESSLAAAAAADEKLAAGEPVGPLHGIPLGIKDIISTTEGTSTAQSLVLDPQWGIDLGDAVVVSRLRAAGGIVMGKLSTMEFACGMPDFERPFPIPRNPWDITRWAGGSSSGSGSSVSTGMVLGALGTDTAGSIRIPAAFCGVTGVMPTFGRVPKSGCVPLGYSLDHIGPLTRSARDGALMLGILAGHDPSDATVVDLPVPDYVAGLTGDLSGLRIGVARLEQFGGALEDPALAGAFDAAAQALGALGADVVPIELPYYAEMMAANLVVMASEAAAYHMPDLQSRWTDYAPGTRNLLSMAFSISSADYVQAQRARRVAQRALADVFSYVDLIVTPTTAGAAHDFPQLETLLADGGFNAIYTQYWDCTGNPAVALPMGPTASGLPLSLQIDARPFDEVTMLRAADAYQRVTDWHLRVPPIAELASHGTEPAQVGAAL
jgi:aspartyl-tRNA(Asn)/glutamyl-tRNA(Gln) amidotransferase subunit A